MSLECKISTGKESASCTAGLGIKVELRDDGALVVKELLPGGQCAKGGMKVGSRIVGFDGKALEDCLEEVTADAFATEAKRRAESDAAAYVLNVDGIPAKDNGDEGFRKLLTSGLQTDKKHQHYFFSSMATQGNIFDQFFNGNKASRVLYHDPRDNKLKVSKNKGDKTEKAMAWTEVTNIQVNAKNSKEMVIESAKVSLKLACPTSPAARTIVKKLHRACSMEQEKEGTVLLRESKLSKASGP